MTTPNQCQFWDCTETIRRNYFLCSNHYPRYAQGAIDQCPECGTYKAANYEVCLNCYRQAQTAGTAAPSQDNAAPAAPDKLVERDDREFPTDKDADSFFVYILLLDGGEYYIGQTREIHERLHEHLNGMSQSTSGRSPKLQWFTEVPTRREAADLEQYLQELNINASRRREITRLVARFKQLAEQLDYTPHRSTAQTADREQRVPYGGVRPPSSQLRRQ